MRLSGYGIELAIKNQEYKAKDDTKVEGWFTEHERLKIGGFQINHTFLGS